MGRWMRYTEQRTAANKIQLLLITQNCARLNLCTEDSTEIFVQYNLLHSQFFLLLETVNITIVNTISMVR
jgi:hypothetical protein